MKRFKFFLFLMILVITKAKAVDHEKLFTSRFGFKKIAPSQSYSGIGSNLLCTETVRQELPELLKQLNCKVIVDAPCGDFFWMKEVDLPIEKYIGVDVIYNIIERNKDLFASDKYSFVHLDVTKNVLPDADLVFCRDMLVHFSNDDIFLFLSQLKKSNIKYFLTTNFIDRPSNEDIKTGAWRPLNLTRPPFNFPQPLITISEKYFGHQRRYTDKNVSLWLIEDIPVNLVKNGLVE